MNNLKDISAEPEYAGMFGYTEAELQVCFSEHLSRKLSQNAYKSQEEFLSALKAYYDGYCFSPYSEIQVYNPVSIGSCLSGKVPGFRNFWMNTGGLSMLAVTLAKRNDLLSIVEKKPELNLQDLFTFDITTLSIAGLKKRDALAAADAHNYIFEFKVDGETAGSVMEQIIDRHYAWLFTGNPKPLHLIGIDFRTKEQQIVSYTHQLYGSDNIEQRTVLS